MFFLEELLEGMKKPMDYNGPEIVIVLRDPNIESKVLYQQFTDTAFGKDVKLTGPVGTFG